MDFREVAMKRESVRNYDSSRPVEDDVLRRVLEVGRLAPSAANRQPWQILAVRSPKMLEKVRACYGKSWFKDAPVILIVKGTRDAAWKKSDGYNSLETDLTIAMDHLILAAENEGLGTCWIAAFDYPTLRSALGLKDNEEVFAITPLGYPRPGYEKSGKKIRRDFDEVVQYL